MPKFDVIKETQEKLTDLFKPKLQLAMGAFLYQDPCGFQPIDAIVAEKAIALRALVRLRRHLITNHALQDRRVNLNVLRTSPVQLYLCFR